MHSYLLALRLVGSLLQFRKAEQNLHCLTLSPRLPPHSSGSWDSSALCKRKSFFPGGWLLLDRRFVVGKKVAAADVGFGARKLSWPSYLPDGPDLID